MPLLTRRTLILAKTETSYGVDALPTGENAILCSAPDLKPVGDVLERDFVKPSLSPNPIVVGFKLYELSFDTELKGSGDNSSDTAILPEIDPLLRAAGFSVTITSSGTPPAYVATYKPISTNIPSCTVYVYLDGVLHKVVGCRANFSLSLEAGKFGKFHWTLKGLYAGPVDSAMVTPTFKQALPPIVKSINFMIDSTPLKCESITLDLGNSFAERKDVNSPDYTGVDITGRKATGSMNPEMELVATHDFFGIWKNATRKTISATIGTDPGNQIVFSSPTVQYKELKYANRDGIRVLDVSLQYAESSLGAEDEIQLVFK